METINRPKPVFRVLFAVSIMLFIASLAGVPSQIVEALDISSFGIGRTLIIFGTPFVTFVLTLVFGILSTKGSKTSALWRLTWLSGVVLVAFLVFNFLCRVIPGLWFLDFLGLHLWVGAGLAIICLVAGIMGLVLSLRSNNTIVEAHKKGLYLFFIAVALTAVCMFTIPIFQYFVNSHQGWQKVEQQRASAPKTAEEWLEKYADSYPTVSQSIKECDVVDVSVRTVSIKGTSAKYLSLLTNSWRDEYSPETGEKIGSSREYYLRHEFEKQLRADLDSVSDICQNTPTWQPINE